eukprot:2139822-Rhodomonas_salina.1
MKNDPYNEGDTVPIAWVTASGIRVGKTVQQYLRRLFECGVGVNDALICPTYYVRGRYAGFTPPAAGERFMPDDCLRNGLKKCFVELQHPGNKH